MKTTDHQKQFEELLPWFVNATLNKEEREWVEQYLSEHPESRHDLRFAETLRKRIRENVEDLSPDIGLDKLMARIRQEKRFSRGQIAPVSIFEKLRSFLSSFALRPAYLAAACVILVQAGVIGTLLHEARQGERDTQRPSEYRSQSATPSGIAVPLLRVTFRADATEREIRALLIDVGGAIVGGPSQLGDYLVLVEASKVEGLAARVAGNQIVDNVTIVRNRDN